MVLYTVYRKYAFPTPDEDLESSNAILKATLDKIDADINQLFIEKATIDDISQPNSIKVWSSLKTYTEIQNALKSGLDASRIMQIVKENDGKGSGVDADLLDGHDSSDFARYNGNSGIPFKVGKAIEDFHAVRKDQVMSIVLANDGEGSLLDADTLDGHHASDFVYTDDYTDAKVLEKIKNVDGAGSGLDADTLDGKEASEFVLKTDYVGSKILNLLKQVDGSDSGLDADLLDGHDSSYFLPASSYTADDVFDKVKSKDGSGSGLDADKLDGHDASYFLPASSYTADDVFSKVTSKDGSGSGLDADKLDGHEATDFVLKAGDTMTGDLGFDSETKGVILIDRSDTSKKYRLYVDGGALKVEAV